MANEPVLNLGEGGEQAFVQRATDPVLNPSYSAPADFTAQYPTPLDTTEILDMCEEITLWKAIPVITNPLNTHTWREMTSLAFTTGLFDSGGYVVTFGLILFAFTTILGWSYYGERCAEYLFGTRIITPYRLLWILAIFIGSVVKLELVWTFADVFNGLMALPNLVALLLLSPIVFSKTRNYFNHRNSEW